MIRISKTVLALVVGLLVLSACGPSETETAQVAEATTPQAATIEDTTFEDATPEDTTPEATQPTVAVTTTILGDVVTQLIGSQAEVYTVMPAGADPHDFSPSAQEVTALLAADVLVANGGGFEEGFIDIIEQAEDEGLPVFAALDVVSALEYADEGTHEHDDHDHDHDDHDHDHDDDHDHGDIDPHFFTDPNRMAQAVSGVAAFLKTELPELDAAQLDLAVETYLTELEALDAEIAQTLASIPDDRRVLVSGHAVLGYFADAYDFEVVGVVIPGSSTNDAVSAGELSELLDVVEAEQVPAIFVDSSGAADLANIVASDAGDLEVVQLYTESLGATGSEGETYLSMMRTNATRLSEALG